MTRTLWRNVVMKIVLNINIRSVLIFDRNLIGGDEVVRSSRFSTCRHDCGRDCHSAVLRGDHHCDMVWWSRWSELGRVARDVVDVVRGRCGRSSAEPLETWSTWSVVGGHVRSSIAWGGKSPQACPAEVRRSRRSSLLA